MKNNTLPLTEQVQLNTSITPDQIRSLIQQKKSFVLNIVTEWCPDCTIKQVRNIHLLIESAAELKLPFHQIIVQTQRDMYLSIKHQHLTLLFGGHGYPRTIHIDKGEIKSNKTEVTGKNDLQLFISDIKNHTLDTKQEY